MRTNPATPRAADSPYREPRVPRLEPCPACGGALVLTLIRGRLELYCGECPWNPDDGAAPEVNQ